MIKVVLVDDQEIFLNALKIMIESDDEIVVAGTAKNGYEGAEICRRLDPDVILMDIMMPIYDGVKGVELIKEFNSKAKVIMLTTLDDDAHVYQSLKKGADGYVLKNTGDKELIKVIKAAAAGFSIIQQKIFEQYKEKQHIPEKYILKTEESNIKLTEREKEVLSLIVDGMSNRDIAAKLFLVEGRVKNIVSSLLSKLDVVDRTQLAVYAIKHNIV
ncbi:response regulator [Pseudobacteroides cellulosolvens]|uniref:Stage 0 sporulation protein A homolog n=1 Tax=Pseudobacteroides cellulosolvens ATCC 35603 = DSM 2933 TaxID=398512 RepID=A0A0L6JH28_9FIRM|nr:response regulator transcription factor [Pseudobacteroides cellulosolvens]KNY24762.1 two component transcriptional regulator, LuxR family [Pseudobacteroides cellulosolvens ATCC 35603 = DSM 2933]